jgi:hypothetical protein
MISKHWRNERLRKRVIAEAIEALFGRLQSAWRTFIRLEPVNRDKPRRRKRERVRTEPSSRTKLATLGPRRFRFETLEPRLLLSADLIPVGVALDTPVSIVSGEHFNLPVEIRNAGSDAVMKPVVQVFASMDEILDEADIVLGEATIPGSLGPNKSKIAKVDIDALRLPAPGTYNLLAVVDPSGSIVESNESNNVRFVEDALSVRWTFQKTQSLTVVDSDGTLVGFTLSGDGVGEVTPVGEGFDVVLTGVTSKTTVNVTTAGGDGRAFLNNLTISGSLKSFKAAKLDLTGDIGVAGTLAALTLGNVVGGGKATISGNGAALEFAAGDVVDFELDVAGAIASIDVQSWQDTDAIRDVIRASSIGSLTSAGNFNASLELSGAGVKGFVLNSASISGMVDGGLWSIGGRVHQIKAHSTSTDWQLNASDAITRIQTKQDLAGQISAPSIQMIRVGGDLTHAVILAGANLGTDVALGGTGTAADTFTEGTLEHLRVRGRVIDSQVFVGVDPGNGQFNDGDDIIVPGSGIKHLIIGSSIDASSKIISGAFPKNVRINGLTASPDSFPALATQPLDTQAPTLTAGLANDSGTSVTDTVTNDPTVEGQASDPGMVVELRGRLDSTISFTDLTSRLQADGAFDLDPATLNGLAGGTLQDGAHVLRLEAVDKAGNVSDLDVAFTLDTTSPEAPVVMLDAASDSGRSNSDGVTNDSTPTFNLTGEAGTTISLFRDALPTGAALTGPNGQITVAPLGDGTYSFTATVTDIAGNVSDSSSAIAVTVDTLAPATPTFDLAPAFDTAPLGDQRTTDATVTLEGTSDPDVTLELLDFGLTPLVEVETDNAGAFSFEDIALVLGANVFTTRATDLAGNSAEFNRTITRDIDDTDAPFVIAALVNDTGISSTDRITFDSSISGTVTDASPIASFNAGFDDTPVDSFFDLLSELGADGQFSLSADDISNLAGGQLLDGPRTLRFIATDVFNNSRNFDLAFTLDTAAPATLVFGLSVASDTGTQGDDITSAGRVVLAGTTEFGARVNLGGQSALAGAGGLFQFTSVALADGKNALTITASDVAGNTREASRTITREGELNADAVLAWNAQALEAIRLTVQDPPIATRILAMMSLAQYDTLAAIEGTPAYLVQRSVSGPVEVESAAAKAAHTILWTLFPSQRASFDAVLAQTLAGIPDGAAKDAALALGQAVAESVLGVRATDGSGAFLNYPGSTQIGAWRPTAPMFEVADQPHWAYVTPFALTSPDQFRPVAPPALDSTEYAESVEEVRSLGSATSTTRTAEQFEIAQFWADGKGSYTPPGHWNQIAQDIALEQGNSLTENVRLFAELNVALADAAIAAWDAKYTYGLWRPIDAINRADQDGNPDTVVENGWTPLLITPFHPEYVSGHSTFSSAAASVLAARFGDDTTFEATAFTLPGVTRSYASFSEAAQEGGRSRIYGGIHYEFTNQAGLTLGQEVANAVLARFALTEDTQAPALVAQNTAQVANTNITLTGQILDNLSGVAQAQYSIDEGAPQNLVLDAEGRFNITTAFALDGSADGVHTIDVVTNDAAGNIAPTFTRSFTLDTQAPVIELFNLEEGATLSAASRLTGTADPTGSTLTALRYSLDGGTPRTIFFDRQTGSFDEALTLGNLGVGEHVLVLSARDAAGNEATLTRNVVLAEAAPFVVTAVTPGNGAFDVGVTFKPQVSFSRSVDPATLTQDSFYATSPDGERIAANIVPAIDGSFAWLFFQSPLPGASVITLHINGDLIRAASGSQMLDADGDGIGGGEFTSTFTTVSRASIPGTKLVGRVVDPGPDLEPMTFDDIRRGSDGIIHTADDVFLLPIANAKVFVLGHEERFVFTDADGYFELDEVPVGNVKVAVDGRTATNAPEGIFFPEMVMDTELLPGYVNTLMASMGTLDERLANLDREEVYLPRVSTSILQTVSNSETTIIGLDVDSALSLTDQQRQFLNIEVQPGSLIGVDGQILVDGQVGISAVAPELIRNMLPPLLKDIPITITIQAPGVEKFAVPVALTYPNVYGAEPGSKMSLFSFDHTTGAIVLEGPATVSDDGLYISTDPDVGITKPGWHFIQIGTGANGAPCFPGEVCVQVNNGLLGNVIDVDLSATRAKEFTLIGNGAASGNGKVAEFPGWELLLFNEGKFYFVPSLEIQVPYRINQAPKNADFRFEAKAILQGEEDKGFQPVRFTVQIKNVSAGYSSFELIGGVGSGPLVNDPIDVYRVQQRLSYLGFTGQDGYLPPPNGIVDSQTVDAIRLFQAATQADGNGNPLDNSLTGTITPGDVTAQWLNQLNAPEWRELRPELRSSLMLKNKETFATSWALDVIDGAVLFRPELLRNPKLVVTALSEIYSDTDNSHHQHKAGLDIDWDVDQELLAANTPEDISSDLTDVEWDVIQDLEAFANAASGQIDEIIFGDPTKSITVGDKIIDGGFPRIREALDILGIPNSTFKDHHNHAHISLKPPSLHGSFSTLELSPPFPPAGPPPPGPSAPTTNQVRISLVPEQNAAHSAAVDGVSTVSGFGGDPRFYYRFQQSDGFEIAGRTDQMGGFREILSPKTDYTVWFYQASTNRSAEYQGRTNASGQVTDLGTIILDQFGGPDTDGDGIPDIGERAIGTSSMLTDTDRDGISDSSELTQGLNPLDGRQAATGILANVVLAGEARAVSVDEVVGTGSAVAAVATGSVGVSFVDVSRAERPMVLRQVALGGFSTDVAFDGSLGYAAVASTSGGLNLVGLDGTVQNIAINPFAVEAMDGIVYANNGAELRAYDQLTGERLQTLDLGGSSIFAMAREGQTLYTVDAARVLRAIDLSSGSMVEMGSLALPVDFPSDIFVGNGIAFVSNSQATAYGFVSVDVSDPTNLQLLSGIDSIDVASSTIAANGSGLALAAANLRNLGNMFQVLDVSDPTVTNRVLTQYPLPGEPFDVAIGGGLAFVANGARGLVVVNYRAFDTQGVAPTVTAEAQVTDIDPATPGIQVQEGTTLKIVPTVTDDVQVRNVELLIDGEVARKDLAFPFELSAALPAIATNGSDTVTLAIRATDTGGNSSVSTPITLQLARDTTPPELISENVSDGAVRGSSFRALKLTFSEAMDTTTINGQTIQLIGAEGVVDPVNIQFRTGGLEAQITYNTLALGDYELRINAPAITDRAGNALGDAVIIRRFHIANFTNEWINPAGGLWDQASNWSAGRVPDLTDDVLIRLPESVTITIGSGVKQVASLVSTEQIQINNAQLVVGSLNISEGAITGVGSLTVNNNFSGTGGSVELFGNVSITQGEGPLNIGATISATNILLNAPTGAIIQAGSGVLTTDGLLNTNSVGAVLNGENRANQFSAISGGGSVEFTNVEGVLTITGIDQSNGDVVITADDIEITGTVNASDTVIVRPHTLGRDVQIASTSTATELNLSPLELGLITADILEVGRSDSSGALRVNSYVDTSNVNVETLRLLGREVAFNEGFGGLGGFNHNLEASANGTVAVNSSNIGLADGRNISLVGDSDSDGSGDVRIETLVGGRFTGISVGTTGDVLLQGQNVVIRGEADSASVFRIGSVPPEGSGDITIRANDRIEISSNAPNGTFTGINTNGGSLLFDSRGATGSGDLILRGSAAGGAVQIFSDGASQTFDLAGNLVVEGGAGTGAFAIVYAGSGNQTLAISGGVTVRAGVGAGSTANIGTTASQEVTAEWIEIEGNGENFAQISVNSPNTGSQSITTTGKNTDGQGIVIRNLGTVNAAIANFGSFGGQTIAVNNADRVTIIGEVGNAQIFSGGFQALSIQGSGQNRLELGDSSAAHRSQILSNGDQSLTVGRASEEGAISLVGGVGRGLHTEIVQNSSLEFSQTIKTSGAITLIGGTAPGAVAANGTTSGGAFARILTNSATGLQSIDANEILFTGGATNINNQAFFRANGSQEVTVGAGGIRATGGGGGAGNSAGIRQAGATGTQTIHVLDGGTIQLFGGSSSDITPGTGGSDGYIRNDGVQQTIEFISGGAIHATGGSVGNDNAGIIFASAGNQLITGNPDITLTGGSGGGVVNDTNGGTISVAAAGGNQEIHAGAITMIGGSGGDSVAATITAPSQEITISGSLMMTGGTNGTSLGGARIGGRGGTTDPTDTNLVLTVAGDLTMTGGDTSGTSIGTSGNAVGFTNDITINVGGSLLMNAGANANTSVRIGSPADDVQTGTISITVGGDVILEGSGQSIAIIRTLGSVTIDTTGVNGQIVELNGGRIEAGFATLAASAGIDAMGLNQVATLTASNAELGNILFNNDVPVMTLNGLTLGIGGEVTIVNTGSIVNTGIIDLNGGTLVTSGNDLTNAASGAIVGNATLLLGGGTLFNEGTVEPFLMSIIGNLVNSDAGRIVVSLVDLVTFGRLDVTGTVTLSGLLEIKRADGFVPPVGSSFTFLTAGTRNGIFATLLGVDIGNGTEFVLNSANPTTLEIVVASSA